MAVSDSCDIAGIWLNDGRVIPATRWTETFTEKIRALWDGLGDDDTIAYGGVDLDEFLRDMLRSVSEASCLVHADDIERWKRMESALEQVVREKWL